VEQPRIVTPGEPTITSQRRDPPFASRRQHPDAIGVGCKTAANLCTQFKAKLATPRMVDLIRMAISCGFGRGEPQLAEYYPAEGDRPS
jgi:hypothetical protein